MNKFNLYMIVLGILTFLPACQASRPAADVTIGGAAAPASVSEKDQSNQSINLSDLPDRLSAYDQAIADLKKENGEITKKLAALEGENASLKQRLDSQNH